MDNHTQVWLSQQPLWYNKDMVTVGLIGLAVGFVAGIIVLNIFC